MKVEILGEITKLRGDFLEMEAGRLTRLEAEFAVVKALVFGVAGLMLTGIIGAIISLVILKPWI